jgi:hypothetical protein
MTSEDYHALCESLQDCGDELRRAQQLLLEASDLIAQAAAASRTELRPAHAAPPPDSAALSVVVQRLRRRFGTVLPHDEIESVVDDEFRELEQAARIDLYLPVLVEHAADERLRAELPRRQVD